MTTEKEPKAPAKKPTGKAESPYPVRGNIFKGAVVSDKMDKSVVVERKLLKYIPKYERYARTKSRITAHVPDGMEVKTGDKVEIGETRKISKTKNFIVLKVEK